MWAIFLWACLNNHNSIAKPAVYISVPPGNNITGKNGKTLD